MSYIFAAFTKTKLRRKLRSFHLLALLCALGRQWFNNKHRIPLSEFEGTNDPWYMHVAGLGVSLELATKRKIPRVVRILMIFSLKSKPNISVLPVQHEILIISVAIHFIPTKKLL